MSDNINLINYIDLSLDEQKIILSWRNHPNIKKWMYTNEEISLTNHLSFIESLKLSKNLYFLVKTNKEYIGTINFTDINNQKAEIGIYSNPNTQGLGTLLLQTLCKYAFNTLNLNKLIAEVFIENEKAIHLYKKFNFKEFAKKTIGNKEVICMELKNENR